ncbi:MAG: prepilin-type N-terminal cleavage/methylation domain-containing protein, partial [Patescibacteria group bacterium]|nr:prepilin-type N-terminal cleavage/methylation domain-containing protein [Patescibacteria group bacterium]
MNNFQFSIFNFQNPKRGFSLVEIIIVIAIATAIFLAVFNFGNSIFSFNSNAQKNLSAQTDARRVLKTMAKELRSASPSSLGSYPVALASSTAITFFNSL